MTGASLGQLWHHLAAWADRQGQPPSHLLIVGTGLLAAVLVASRRAWPVARTVVTIAHEGGHALAGYIAAPLLGLGAAALLASGHPMTVLLLSLAGLAGLLFAIRNAYGLLAVLVAGAVVVVVLWQHSAVAAAALGYTMTWLLLFGGVRPVLELARDRRWGRGRSNDADQLARLTGLPGGLWVGVFGVVAVGALGLGGWLLMR